MVRNLANKISEFSGFLCQKLKQPLRKCCMAEKSVMAIKGLIFNNVMLMFNVYHEIILLLSIKAELMS